MNLQIVVLDANVLYPAELRNFFMRLATEELFLPRWTNEIHEEWIRNVLEDRIDITPEMLKRTRQLMDRHIDDCLVEDYESLINKLELPDPDDRHVLAAAIKCKATSIVTFNLKDFPLNATSPHNTNAHHPDQFIKGLLDVNAGGVCMAARKHRSSLKNPSKNVDEYLASLERNGLPMTVERLRSLASLL